MSKLDKLIQFISGFLLGVIVIALFVFFLSSFLGLFLGIIVGGLYSIYVLKMNKQNKVQVVIAYGVLTSVVLILILSLILYVVLLFMYQGIVS